MLTVIAEIRTRPGQHHRQAVLDQFAKIVPTVLKEELGVVLKKVVVVDAQFGALIFITKAEQPAADRVSHGVGVDAFTRVAPTGVNDFDEIFYTVPHGKALALPGIVVDDSAKLIGHFNPSFEDEREFIFIAETKKSRFAVIEDVVGILFAGFGISFFPIIIREEAVAEMAFNTNPV